MHASSFAPQARLAEVASKQFYYCGLIGFDFLVSPCLIVHRFTGNGGQLSLVPCPTDLSFLNEIIEKPSNKINK